MDRCRWLEEAARSVARSDAIGRPARGPARVRREARSGVERPMTSRLPDAIASRVKLPLIAAPMLLVSGPDLVVEACRAGIVGSFPTKNCRTTDELERWLARMQEETARHAPFAPNLIVHKTNTRLEEDTRLVEKYAPAFVITSVGSPAPVMDRLHAIGTLVFA